MATQAMGTAAAPMIAPSRRALAGLVLAAGNFMVVLDLSIANVSVPHIAGDLGISMDQGAWIITSYAVAEAICVPLTGWIAQRFGAVRAFVLAMLGFGLFSAMCGLSISLTMLVVCRIGQGLCGAPLMPISQTLMLRVFPPEQRGMAMGIWAMTTLAGPAMGPIIGGTISDNLSWHWIFLINIPLAVLCAAAAWWLLRGVETPTRKLPIDGVGLILLVFWIGALQIMLDIGRDHDWFADPLIVALAIMAFLGFLVFVIWELTEEHPIVNLRIFANRSFSAGVFTLALSFGAYFAGIVIIPQWLQTSLGYTATLAGLTTAFAAMAAITTSQIAARMLTRADPRLMVSLAVGWLGLMTLLRVGWTTDADFWTLSLPQLLQGFGMSFFMIPLTVISLSTIKPQDMASATGLQSFVRTLALAVSTSLALSIWGNAQRTSHNALADTLQPDATMATLSAQGMSTEQARQIIASMVDQEATTLALNHTFLISAVVLFVAAGLIWLSPRPRPSGTPIEGAH